MGQSNKVYWISLLNFPFYHIYMSHPIEYNQ